MLGFFPSNEETVKDLGWKYYIRGMEIFYEGVFKV